jgi:two-component sensor histidine kinase
LDAALLIVAVNEAVTNSVQHAYLDRARGTVSVRAEVSTAGAAPDGHRVTVVVASRRRSLRWVSDIP